MVSVATFDNLEWEWHVTTSNWQNPCGQYVRAWVDEARVIYVTLAYSPGCLHVTRSPDGERQPEALPPWVWTLYSSMGVHDGVALDWHRAETIDAAVGEFMSALRRDGLVMDVTEFERRQDRRARMIAWVESHGWTHDPERSIRGLVQVYRDGDDVIVAPSAVVGDFERRMMEASDTLLRVARRDGLITLPWEV